MKVKTNIKISAPATIANLACGFEVLGLAINAPKDEIIVSEAEKPGVHITTIINNKTKIPLDASKNTATIAAQSFLDFLIKEHSFDKDIGINFKIIKKVPIGFGLGSSTASAVAGVVAVNEALGTPFRNRELVSFAAKGDLYYQNSLRINSVVPALIGGIVLTRSHKELDFHRLPVPKGLHIVVVYPDDIALSSRNMRNNIAKKAAMPRVINQVANLGSFVHALYMSDFDLLARSLKDELIEYYWTALIPFFKEIQAAALAHQALGCSIAGTGSGIFAMCKNSLDAENVAQAMQEVLTKNKIKSTYLISTINQQGSFRE